jgi:hypothetical protein
MATPEQPAATVLELVALTLASYGDTSSELAEEIPQAVWDDLHERGLVQTVREYGGDGRTE